MKYYLTTWRQGSWANGCIKCLLVEYYSFSFKDDVCWQNKFHFFLIKNGLCNSWMDGDTYMHQWTQSWLWAQPMKLRIHHEISKPAQIFLEWNQTALNNLNFQQATIYCVSQFIFGTVIGLLMKLIRSEDWPLAQPNDFSKKKSLAIPFSSLEFWWSDCNKILHMTTAAVLKWHVRKFVGIWRVVIKSLRYTGGDFMFLYRFVCRRRNRRRLRILVHTITLEQLFGFLSFCRRRLLILVHAITFEQLFGFLPFFARLLALTYRLLIINSLWPWPWIFKVKYGICYISAKNGPIAMKRKANTSIEL